MGVSTVYWADMAKVAGWRMGIVDGRPTFATYVRLAGLMTCSMPGKKL